MGEAASKFVMVTPEELAKLIRAELRAELATQKAEQPNVVLAKAFAAEQGVTSHAVRQWCRDGMPHKRSGSAVRVLRAEALEWLKNRPRRDRSKKAG